MQLGVIRLRRSHAARTSFDIGLGGFAKQSPPGEERMDLCDRREALGLGEGKVLGRLACKILDIPAQISGCSRASDKPHRSGLI